MSRLACGQTAEHHSLAVFMHKMNHHTQSDLLALSSSLEATLQDSVEYIPWCSFSRKGSHCDKHRVSRVCINIMHAERTSLLSSIWQQSAINYFKIFLCFSNCLKIMLYFIQLCALSLTHFCFYWSVWLLSIFFFWQKKIIFRKFFISFHSYISILSFKAF